MNEAEFVEMLERKLLETPTDIIAKSLAFLRGAIEPELQEYMLEVFKEGGPMWFMPQHMGLGLKIRNRLRECVAPDEALPDKNWDDYYIQMIEMVIGVRAIPARCVNALISHEFKIPKQEAFDKALEQEAFDLFKYASKKEGGESDGK